MKSHADKLRVAEDLTALHRQEWDENPGTETASASAKSMYLIGKLKGQSAGPGSEKLKKKDPEDRKRPGTSKAGKPNKKGAVNSIRKKVKTGDGDESGVSSAAREMQRKRIRNRYAAAKRRKDLIPAGKTAEKAGTAISSGISRITGVISEIGSRVRSFAVRHIGGLLTGGVVLLPILVIISAVSSCSVSFPGTTGTVWATSYTAEDEDIKAAEEAYKDMEAALLEQVDDIESDYPGYDEYRIQLSEVGHDPYKLASYLTVLYENYTLEQVKGKLREIFDSQYTLEIGENVEIRTRTVTTESTDPETGQTTTDTYEEEYEYHILNVTLTNSGIDAVVQNAGLDKDSLERYGILNSTYGNRKALFEDNIYAVAEKEYTDYDIPAEALTETRFANMIREAEKYLGKPYVWGGDSPSTGFDCSGFVSWVINHCGNGWSIGRQTANGLLGYCDKISKEDAQPGDLIFFKGTYKTSGASHVGIYVGNGMMIHCGNPISYASVNTNYWKEHYYVCGRIR